MMRTQINHSTGSRPQRAELRCLLAVLPVILAALLCLTAATLAWFQFTRTNPGNSVQAGSFGLTVQVTDAAGQQLQPTEGGFALDKGASYTVSLAASGTTGFCTVSGPGQFLRATQAIPADGLVFTLAPDESGTYAFAPSWGSPENYGYDGQTLIKNNDTVGTPAAPAPEPVPGTASAVRPAEGWTDTTLTAPGQENALPETSVTVPAGAIDETAEQLVLTVASAGMPEGIAVQEGEKAETWQIGLSGLKENNAAAVAVRMQLSMCGPTGAPTSSGTRPMTPPPACSHSRPPRSAPSLWCPAHRQTPVRRALPARILLRLTGTHRRTELFRTRRPKQRGAPLRRRKMPPPRLRPFPGPGRTEPRMKPPPRRPLPEAGGTA